MDVRDDGPGVPEIERRAILLDHEIDQLNHSTGLGILFAYWVARLSEGSRTIQADDPGGSVVTLTLPTAESG
ncbi:hypothetical protein [Haloplanus pelagicus]|uniref:hypothetical protein n=1 Tax=Haloplanus pelagicus TaxID=2949995 RepID=UPI003CE49E37